MYDGQQSKVAGCPLRYRTSAQKCRQWGGYQTSSSQSLQPDTAKKVVIQDDGVERDGVKIEMEICRLFPSSLFTFVPDIGVPESTKRVIHQVYRSPL